MRIAIAQLNPTVGDLAGNVAKIEDAVKWATAQSAQLLIVPELAVCGYPPRDLLDSKAFVQDALKAGEHLARNTGSLALCFGAVVGSPKAPWNYGKKIYNGAVLARDGQLLGVHRKILLPTYDVFDERRYFSPGNNVTVIELEGMRLGLTVCEDMWNDQELKDHPSYTRDPIHETAQVGCDAIINISASPYEHHKPQTREEIAKRHSRNNQDIPFLYVNQVGGNDSLLFDGTSFALKGDTITARMACAQEQRDVWELVNGRAAGSIAACPSSNDQTIELLCLGIRDYVRKCGFRDTVVGLSGGIDSALTTALAVRALGPEHVMGLAMPSRYSSEHSLSDAFALAKNLGISCEKVSIEPMFVAYQEALAPIFGDRPADVTEENLQARIRGALLMAVSNKFGSLLLTTGNKSELAVGYSTLYGDMCGGLAVISDLYKTEVYDVSRSVNQNDEVIPSNSITKPPSAELRPDQTDQDSLPPYEILDPILRGFIDEQQSETELIAAGHDPKIVERTIQLVMRNEYKRRQMPPGLRVSHKAFGEGRRLPIACRRTRLM